MPAPVAKPHRLALPIEERSARLEAAEICRNVDEAVVWLTERGFPVDRTTLRGWWLRHGIGPRGGLTVSPATMLRLEAAEAMADHVMAIVDGLPAGLSPAGAAVALGEVKAACHTYRQAAGAVRGLVPA